jgi:hypothetical protein
MENVNVSVIMYKYNFIKMRKFAHAVIDQSACSTEEENIIQHKKIDMMNDVELKECVKKFRGFGWTMRGVGIK